MNEIEAMGIVSSALEPLEDDERSRVLVWAHAKFGNIASAPFVSTPAPTPDIETTQLKEKSKAKAKSTKKAKTVISMDKSLDLMPAGKISAVDFANGKAPSNAMQKCVVAVHYLRDTVQMPAVTVSGVYTFFKALSWPVPADLKNTLQQAGTQGWLDTANGEDIKLTSIGENLVEHNLPSNPKTK